MRHFSITDHVLDALDDAPNGWLSGIDGHGSYTGQLATVQWVASYLGISDSTARRAIHHLRIAGLVTVWDALDPKTRSRRLYVSGAQS